MPRLRPSVTSHVNGRPRVSSKSVCFAPNLQEHFLENVFRFLAVIQYTHQQPKQDGAIAVVELCEGRLVPGGNRLEQRNIVLLCWFRLQAVPDEYTGADETGFEDRNTSGPYM